MESVAQFYNANIENESEPHQENINDLQTQSPVKTHESNKTIVKAELRDVKYDKQPKE